MLSRRQIGDADRVGGIELMIPWPAELPPSRLPEGYERDASPAERAAAERILGDLSRHGLVLVRVQVAVVERPEGLPRDGQVLPHLACIIIGRRWVHARTSKKPRTAWLRDPDTPAR